MERSGARWRPASIAAVALGIVAIVGGTLSLTSGGASTPTGVAKQMISLVEQRRFDEVDALFCPGMSPAEEGLPVQLGVTSKEAWGGPFMPASDHPGQMLLFIGSVAEGGYGGKPPGDVGVYVEGQMYFAGDPREPVGRGWSFNIGIDLSMRRVDGRWRICGVGGWA